MHDGFMADEFQVWKEYSYNEFISTYNEIGSMNSLDDGDSMFEIIFLQSDNIQYIERDVYTILDALT